MKLLLIFCFITPVIISQHIQNNFIDALINNKENINDYADKDELKRSERLGIKYNDVKYKWLISYDIPEEIKSGFRDAKYSYSLQQMQLEDGFSVVTLAVPSVNYLQKFYFLNDKFVPPSRYFSRNWEEKESKYFNFRISEPEYFNDYCIKRLDNFVDTIAGKLGFTTSEIELLSSEKIYYTFCKSEDEVEKITGYKSKGMAVLAFDEVITAYQTHFHEAAHLLINYKLKNLGLYTLPFFMEGFAVATGGRGGMASRVVTVLGYYLQNTGFLTYDSILTSESFYNIDANMTYAVSGLYNSFLLNELGAYEYLDMYRKVNGDLSYVQNIKSRDIKLPTKETFEGYLNKYSSDSLYKIQSQISENNNYYCFPVEKSRKFIPLHCSQSDNSVYNNYHSRLYSDLTGSDYNEEHYLIKSDSTSVKLYNCYNDELIFSYDKSFILDPDQFKPEYNKMLNFCLKNNLFDCKPYR